MSELEGVAVRVSARSVHIEHRGSIYFRPAVMVTGLGEDPIYLSARELKELSEVFACMEQELAL